ncbi:hypothetical protein GBF38_001709 [Nibea albiflora]|uniref:Uncharacterized protein n=1 Tax=Nibea albiflora TaxID=240163 RepID=A0ACB7EU33_NIBAL|nr:hypothetical protein GBF38_001709 [Nibea albiflora]
MHERPEHRFALIPRSAAYSRVHHSRSGPPSSERVFKPHVQRSCREEEEEEGGGDVFSSAHCDCELGEGLSLSGRLRSVRDYPPTALK